MNMKWTWTWFFSLSLLLCLNHSNISPKKTSKNIFFEFLFDISFKFMQIPFHSLYVLDFKTIRLYLKHGCDIAAKSWLQLSYHHWKANGCKHCDLWFVRTKWGLVAFKSFIHRNTLKKHCADTWSPCHDRKPTGQRECSEFPDRGFKLFQRLVFLPAARTGRVK